MTEAQLTQQQALTDASQKLRKTGLCVCCGEKQTRSLFAMGHDARFRGTLARALAASGWDTPVSWFVGASECTQVTVREAVDAVRGTLGVDWTEKVEKSAVRSTTVRTAAPLRGSDEGASQTRGYSESYIDELIDRLERNPLVGQWGWYRAPKSPNVAFAARVQRTRRDAGSSEIDLLVVRADGSRELLIEQPSTSWLRDEGAKT